MNATEDLGKVKRRVTNLQRESHLLLISRSDLLNRNDRTEAPQVTRADRFFTLVNVSFDLPRQSTNIIIFCQEQNKAVSLDEGSCNL